MAPPGPNNESLKVKTAMHLEEVDTLDDKNRALALTVTLVLSWKDPRFDRPQECLAELNITEENPCLLTDATEIYDSEVVRVGTGFPPPPKKKKKLWLFTSDNMGDLWVLGVFTENLVVSNVYSRK